MSENRRSQSRASSSLTHPIRDYRGRGYGPLLLGALVFVGVFFVAREYCEHLPVMRISPADQLEDVIFIGPRENTFLVHGDLEHADLLFVGDSRISSAIVPLPFEEAGLGHVATIWCLAAQFDSLVSLAERYPELPMVLAISPLGFGTDIHEVVAEINRARHPGFDADLEPREVARWAEGETEHLIAKGMDEGLVRLALRGIQDSHREVFQHSRRSTANVDADLNRWLDVKRCELVNPIRTQLFRFRWTDPPDEKRSDGKYAWGLRSELSAERQAKADHSIARLKEIRSRRKIALVRLPISTSLRSVEDQCVGADWIDELVEETGRPFKDFGAGGYPTHDGSHLIWPAAKEVSRDLAKWLKDDLGW